jgi:hypothetical protein
MEPEAGDQHTVFVDELLMNPGTESYNLPRRFLDSQMPAPKVGDARGTIFGVLGWHAAAQREGG